MVINWLDFIWRKLTLGGISEQSLSPGHFPLVELSLARLFNSHWHNFSTVTGASIQQWLAKFFQQSLARFFNSQWHDSSTVIGTIIQQSLARLFNSHWHDCSTVTDTIMQQWLGRVFNSGWHEYSTVTDTAVQRSLARFFKSHWHDSMLAEFFNSVEESCHVPGMRHRILSIYLILN